MFCFLSDPLPVVNITVTENNQIVTVTWQTAAGSKQDKYRFMYRSVLRDPSAHWLEQTAVTEATQFSGAFPGEMYEISIIAISNEQESVPSNTSVVIGKHFCLFSCLAVGFLLLQFSRLVIQ